MGRRFVTRTEVEAALDAGHEVLEVGPRDTVTDLARELAQSRGLRIDRSESGGAVGGAADEDLGRLRRQVRRAVVAELGESPPGLDEAIDRALGS